MTPEISIIIPTKNGKKHLEQTLPETIKACRNASVKTEIIVVDDNSEDGTLKLKKDYPQIKFLKNPSKIFKYERLPRDANLKNSCTHPRYFGK